eukprot:2249906-Rhodomonas_salina.2
MRLIAWRVPAGAVLDVPVPVHEQRAPRPARRGDPPAALGGGACGAHHAVPPAGRRGPPLPWHRGRCARRGARHLGAATACVAGPPPPGLRAHAVLRVAARRG